VSEEKKGGIAAFKVSYGKPGEDDDAREISTERGTFRVVIFSELSPRAEFSTAARPELDAKPIDKYTFDERLSDVAGSLAIEVPDPFDPGASAVRCDIRIADLRSLRPDGLAEQASLLRSLLEARKALIAVRDGRTQLSEVSGSLRRILPREGWAEMLVGSIAPAPAAPAPTTGGLDALFDQIDLKPEQRAASVIGAMIRKDAPKGVASAAGSVQQIEQAFVATMRNVLRHPEVRRLEQAWRGVRLVVDRINHKAGVEVDIVSVGQKDIDNGLVALVADSTSGNSARAPADLLVIDHEIGPDELASFEAWGEAAELLRAPIVANGTIALLGFPDIPTMQKSERRIDSLDDARSAKLRGLSSRDRARWLALAVNRVLVRAAYEPSTARFREIPFEEDAADPASHVFAGPALAVAIIAAASWVRNGFASELVGPRNGVVENLPVRDVRAEGAHYAFPLEHLVSVDTQSAVGKTALILVGCSPNHDAAILANASTLFRGESVARGVDAEPMALGDQLFVARMSHAIEQLAAAIPAGTPEDAIRDVTRVALTELFKGKGGAPDLQVAIGKEHLEVTVIPKRYAGVTLSEFTLSAKLG
jgi:type VI secretion system protein ImpC